MSYNSKYTGVQVEDALGKAMTATQTLSFANLTAADWVADSTYADYGYRCDVACAGVTTDDFAEVVFDLAESTSGNYAPICETKDGAVSIWSKVADTIIIPTIIITR
jgi:hypothetical protein